MSFLSARRAQYPAAPRLLWHLVRQDFIDRYSGSALGVTWTLIVPLMQILVFTLVFGKLIGPRIPGSDSVYAYGLYLVSGILPWIAFSNTLGRTTNVFVEKARILSKVRVHLWQIAAHIAIAEAVTLSAVLVMFFGVMVLLFGMPPATILFAPVLVLFQQLLAFTIGLFGAALTVFLRDVKELVSVVVFMWFWVTPIVYLAQDVPDIMQQAQAFNPAFWFVAAWHAIIVYGELPDLTGLAIKFAGILGLCTLFLALLARWEREIRDFI